MAPSPTLVSDDFIIRLLTSADIPRIRDMHSALLPVKYPLSFFRQLLLQPSHLCLVAYPSSGPNAPVAFISACIHPSSRIFKSFQINSPYYNISLGLGTPSIAPQPKFVPKQAEPHVQILTLGVLPPYRRRGLARLLLKTAVLNLRDRLASRPLSSPRYLHPDGTLVSAHVSTSNASAHQFYERIGLDLSPEVARDMYRTLPYGSRDAYLVVGRVQ